MRKAVKTVGIFSIAFLVGTGIYYLIPRTEVANQKTQAIIEQPITSEVAIEKAETSVPSKIFDVKNFFDEHEKYNRDFLEVGEVSNVEDIKVKSGETWLGLFSKDGREVLRPTKLKVKFTKASEKNGLEWKEISVNEKSEPLFLINKKRLRGGEVRTLFRGLTWKEASEKEVEQTTMKDGFNKKFYLNDVEYTLRTEKGISTENQKILVLILETAKTSQIIHYVDLYEDWVPVGDLYWVGDLDRDGKLDLYMDFWNDEKGYYWSGIFLSSEAEKGKLVKTSNYYMLGGC